MLLEPSYEVVIGRCDALDKMFIALRAVCSLSVRIIYDLGTSEPVVFFVKSESIILSNSSSG
jgi:hypothetical protein